MNGKQAKLLRKYTNFKKGKDASKKEKAKFYKVIKQNFKLMNSVERGEASKLMKKQMSDKV